MNRVFKALAHPVRRKIIGMLRARPMLSGEIAQAFDMAWPSVTAHLSDGLVETAISMEPAGGELTAVGVEREFAVERDASASV